MIATFNGKQAGKQVVQIACGSTYSAAVTADGELFTWGRGNYGRLGHGEPLPPVERLHSLHSRTLSHSRHVLISPLAIWSLHVSIWPKMSSECVDYVDWFQWFVW